MAMNEFEIKKLMCDIGRRVYDRGMVAVEFFGSFSCSCKRISFNDGSQLVVVNFHWLATMFSFFKTLVSFAEYLELPLHYMFISSSWAKCVVDIVSCLHCFMTHFELKLKKKKSSEEAMENLWKLSLKSQN